jgi:anti-sigma-K factor RskA
MRVITLTGTASVPGASGLIVASMDGLHGTLVVDNLPVLDKNHAYQLWLIKDGQRTSGGVFSVGPDGYGALWVTAPKPLLDYPNFGVTIEPAGGSPGPTGEKVLGGGL